VKSQQWMQVMAWFAVAGPALAQDHSAAQDGNPALAPMPKLEVTGSSIRRVAKEGALPVQIISFEQLDKQGITSAEQLLRIISANGTGADNMTSGNNVFGADADRVSGGASFASLRGLGPSSTLVLLNGRRLASHGAREALNYSGGWNRPRKKCSARRNTADMPGHGEDLQRS
jgi:iron complex outermembrane receptor protein